MNEAQRCLISWEKFPAAKSRSDSIMLFGFLNIKKPKGMTSHDVVARVRKIANVRQVGHAGTLDPDAEGVLPVAVGKATRLIQYLPGDKTYVAEILLGLKTDTDDLAGKVLEERPVNISE